jgi:pimeloyl-ACP methyl ester carboxylesterase
MRADTRSSELATRSRAVSKGLAAALAGPAAAVFVALLVAVFLPERAAAEHDVVTGTPAVAFLVNGYGGCCIPGNLRDTLRGLRDENTNARLIAVHVSNWNHVNQGGNPGAFPFGGFPDPFTDETFIQQVQAEVKEIDAVAPKTKLVLVGHSFGGDAALQVAKRLEVSPGVRRPIAFLAVLDPVGRAGSRANLTSPAPSNVGYFYNRWQTNFAYPLDFLTSGRISSNADESNQGAQSLRKTRGCKVKYTLGFIPELMLHAQVPNDSCVQAQLKRIIEARVLNPNPRVLGASIVLSGGITGVRVRFSDPISVLSFTLADVLSSTPRAATAIEAIPGSDSQDFLIRFEPPPFVPPPAARPMRLVLGPDIYDADAHPMDQDLDLRSGEALDDRYVFEFGVGGPVVVTPRIVGLKFVQQAEGRVRTIVRIMLTFDRDILRASATDLENYRLVSPDGPRIVYGRARGPSDGPGTTVFGLPPGNVSVPLASTITVDRMSPAVVISFSSTRVQVGSAVTMNASASRDSAGFGADSGLNVDSGGWSFGDGTTASGLVATHAYGQPGTYRGSFSVADQVGNQTTAEFSIEVVAAPVTPTPGSSQTRPATTPETIDRTAPRLSNVAVRRLGTRPTLAFRLSERGTLAVEVVRLSPRPVWRVAAFTRQVRAGRGQVAFPRGAFRRQGRYRIRVVARDAARNASAPRTLTIRRR